MNIKHSFQGGKTQLISFWQKNKLHTNSDNLASWWKKIDDWKKVNCLHFEQKGDVIKPQQAIKRLYDLRF